MFGIAAMCLTVAQPVVAWPAFPRATVSSPTRAAVARALPYLKEEGIEWARRRRCHSCHHVGFMVWGLHEARRHGLDVDVKELSQWADWAVQYGSRRAVYDQADPAALDALQKAGLAEHELAPLRNLKRTFARADDFRAELSGLLPADQRARPIIGGPDTAHRLR